MVQFKKKILVNAYILQLIFPFFYFIGFFEDHYWRKQPLIFIISLVFTIGFYSIVWRLLKMAIISEKIKSTRINIIATIIVGIWSLTLNIFCFYYDDFFFQSIQFLELYLAVSMVFLVIEIFIFQIMDTPLLIKVENGVELKNSNDLTSLKLPKLPKWTNQSLINQLVFFIFWILISNFYIFRDNFLRNHGIANFFIFFIISVMQILFLSYFTGTFRYYKILGKKKQFNVSIWISFIIYYSVILVCRYNLRYGIFYRYFDYYTKSYYTNFGGWTLVVQFLVLNIIGILLYLTNWIKSRKFLRILLSQTSINYQPPLIHHKMKHQHLIESPFESFSKSIEISLVQLIFLYFYARTDAYFSLWLPLPLFIGVYFIILFEKNRPFDKVLHRILSWLIIFVTVFAVLLLMTMLWFQTLYLNEYNLNLIQLFLLFVFPVIIGLIRYSIVKIIDKINSKTKILENESNNNQYNRLLGMHTKHRCLNCNIIIEPDVLELLQTEEFVFCKYCGQKIRRKEIFPVNEDDLLQEHAKILEKLHNKESQSPITE